MDRLRSLLAGARKGYGGAVVLEGPAGSGKTSLVRAALRSVPDMAELTIAGLPGDREHSGAGLERLLGAAGRDASGPSGSFGAGLVLLEELSRLAGVRPLVVVVDDAQWLDAFTCEVLVMLSRSLEGTSAALVVATRPEAPYSGCFAGIPRISLGGSAPRAGIEIRLLGGLEVKLDGRMVHVGEGTVATAVKVVALRGQLPAEELEEILWPEAEPGRGRVRLRNVLHRVRQGCGPVLVRDGRVVRLAPGTEVDAQLFEELAEKALTAASCRETEASELARRALNFYRGELLPVDRSADWTIAPRERLARLHLALLDYLQAEVAERGDTTEALRILEEAIGKDPYNESRYIRAARLLADRGSVSQALAMLRRAQVAMGRLGVPTVPAVDELMRELSE